MFKSGSEKIDDEGTMSKKLYFKYWGKARREGSDGDLYHLLPYHCLDVAAVADIWWEKSDALRQAFIQRSGLSQEESKAWVLFFIALHDYGKLDMRFQLKAPKAVAALYPDFDRKMTDLGGIDIGEYFHGLVGYSLLYCDLQPLLDWNNNEDIWDVWQPWLTAVTGHHGECPHYVDGTPQISQQQADDSIIQHDNAARLEWVRALEEQFLVPCGLSIYSPPPTCNELIAGFCSVSDWLGSNSEEQAFEYQSTHEVLGEYYQRALLIAEKLLHQSGLISKKQRYLGVESLLPKGKSVSPRQLQTLVKDLPVESGLTIIEAPTGSGKTETALAYAWQLLEQNLADSIIFALPTQATANAMLKRLEDSAPLLFDKQPNLVLAHGKASFNDDFWQLKDACQQKTEQGETEARVQCAKWLSSSRKRVFLGQIGVCTVDQVLISVLPVRHKFVRSFGIGKSVLIIDEVHAYDSYMYGLLGEVLKQQRLMGGSALLLSATLPYHQCHALGKTWGGALDQQASAPYPLITHIGFAGNVQTFELPESEYPKPLSIQVEVVEKHELLADSTLFEQMIQAAREGAQVVFICNLVDVAQAVAKQLKELSNVTVDLFHARYRFIDRQTIEKQVLDKYGKKGSRKRGNILIATQVVEQSLDLDFDWMITQLCPVDLLFQRLGRLHRHKRQRPTNFKQPKCTVLIPDDEDYGYHGLIYGNTRVLWRTAQMLSKAQGEIHFPAAYRTWIEMVYQENEWGDEPEAVMSSYKKYVEESDGSYFTAKQLMAGDIEALSDTDSNVSALTRDGEMSLNILPLLKTAKGLQLIGEQEQMVDSLDEWWRDEALSMNMVAVPQSWRKFLPETREGVIVLEMTPSAIGYSVQLGDVQVRYSIDFGLENNKNRAGSIE